MKRFFNVAGPCVAGKHYMLSPAARCMEVFSLIEQESFFVIHAARQTGKTTMLISLTQELEAAGQYHAMYVSLESCQGIADPQVGLTQMVYNMRNNLEYHPSLSKYPFLLPDDNPSENYAGILKKCLTRLASALDRPLVVFFDEVDCLANGTLISFLRQLRDGYVNRAMAPFVHSLALVGMRDVRDYKAKVRSDRETLGSASPFNIKTKSLILRNFTRDEVANLYAQHTEATGQGFPEEVVDRVFEQTQGQPWLVNAIAREMVMEIAANDPTIPLTLSMTEDAVQNIILRRETHIDSLLERLKEPRVRHCIEPMLLGEDEKVDPTSDDVSYVLDMGLCRLVQGRLVPGNPIYAEVIGRTLSWRSQFYMEEARMPFTLQRFGTVEGGLDMNAMMSAFQQFWRENSGAWADMYDYKEAAPHLILMAFLQRVVNGGGRIVREFATGSKRMDLIVELNVFRYPVEIKLWRGPKTIKEGLEQLSGYLGTLGLKEGWLVIFDRRPDVSWDEKIYVREETDDTGRILYVIGM
ncbi:MAG: ATP-binding protein [Spartobacteria bacterium]|nr:ATP-binding protein [Spartobacteria bacterium]